MSVGARTTIAAVFIAAALTPYRVSAQSRVLTVDDVINLESAEQFDVSPDGRWIAWVKTVSNKEKNERRGDVFITRPDGVATVQLTRGADDDGSPRFSPGGGRLAFRRSESDKAQVYVLDLRGGEAEKVTDAESGIVAFDWIDDSTLVYSAREDSTLRERRLKKNKDDTIVVADQEHYAPVRLFVRNLTRKETRRLTSNEGAIVEFALSPDGRRVVTGENQDVNYEYNYDQPPKQFLVEVAGGTRREICTRPYVDPHDFAWNADGTGFYCIRDIGSDSTDTFVAIEQLYYYDLAADSLRVVPLGWENGLGRGFRVVEDGVVVALADGVTDRIAHVTGNGFRVRFIDTEKPIRLAGSQRSGRRVVYTRSDASTIPEVMTATVRDGHFENPVRLVDLNEKLARKTLSETAIVHWAGARGDTVDGILYYPIAYDTSTTYPLVVLIHGGPTGVDPDYFTERWSNYPHALAAKGTFVLKVNYHGSGNYGLAWMESIKGHYYELEVPDILSGVDYLVETGLVDANRVGIMGWSNGSILAIECCLESDRFKALCAGAGDVNWTSDYGNCRFGSAFDDAYFGGPPWSNAQVYVDKSPLFRMEEMKTPTLIMFGARDTSVPTEQGWEHFRAMQTIGAAPVRFLLFPGTGHGLTKLSHRRRKMQEELAWFDRYLFGVPADTNEAVADGSLLAHELEKAGVQRVGQLYGAERDAALIPEVVLLEGVAVGRFEVTRAQFAAFDPNYAYAPGTDNLPITNVSLPLAQTYCMWLSEKTGETYRLPTAAEMDKLLSAARAEAGTENTLERWVGYRPTPDELTALRGPIERLEATRSLLEPVGSFAPAGKSGVYDLGGNAAEWTTGPDGAGVIRGYSAVTCADSLDGYVRPPLSYVGFRVVRR